MSRRVKEYFEEVSSQWDSLRKSFYGDEVREAVLKAAQVGAEDTVLDVGAGTGFLTEAAAKLAKKVIALDFSINMTNEATAKLTGKNVEFKLGSADHMPLADSSVDVAIGNMILHHCPDPPAAIREIARVMKPGGRTALSDMQEHSHEWLRTERADLWLGFRMKDVEKMLMDAGLTGVKVEALSVCCSSEREEQQVEIPMFLAYGKKANHAL